MLDKRKEIGYKYNHHMLLQKVKGLSSISPLARQVLRDMFDKIWFSENLAIEDDEILISYFGITKSKWKSIKNELISLNNSFISFDDKNKIWTSKWLNSQNKQIKENKNDFLNSEKEDIFNQVDSKLIEINKNVSKKSNLKISETVYDRSKFIEHELKEKINSVSVKDDEEEINNEQMDIAIKSFLKINKIFNSLYLDAWTKNASEEEFRNFWINYFYDKNITEKDIDIIVEKVSKKESFSEYPPNLASFNNIYYSILMEKNNIPSKEEAFRIAYENNRNTLLNSHPVVLETIKKIQDYRIMSDPYIKKEFFETYENIVDDFIANPNKDIYKKNNVNKNEDKVERKKIDNNEKLKIISRLTKD